MHDFFFKKNSEITLLRALSILFMAINIKSFLGCQFLTMLVLKGKKNLFKAL